MMYGYIATDTDGKRNFFPDTPPARHDGRWKTADGKHPLAIPAGMEPLAITRQTYADDPEPCAMEIFTQKTLNKATI